MDGLARFCVAELASRGLHHAVTEVTLPGGGREKSWDVAWRMDDKPRLAVSLKSLLKNLGGTVPNRVDDLMGEVTNVQMYSPDTLTDLISLDGLNAYRTRLCAPRDPGFRRWLVGLGRAEVDTCGRAPYLIQAVQSSDTTDSVPLVAGEDALLRVFLESEVETDEDLPKVRARFYRNGVHSYATDIPRESGRPIPRETDEGDLTKSVNHEIPGWVIQPGLEVVLLIDPDSTLDLDRLGIPSRIPGTGRMAIEVRSVRLLDITAIPFLWESDPDS